MEGLELRDRLAKHENEARSRRQVRQLAQRRPVVDVARSGFDDRAR